MQLKNIRASVGYTLIEVLVVMLIIAIITTVAVLIFSNFNRGRRLKIAVDRVLQTIEVAQQEAILRPAVLGMRITSTGYQFYQLLMDEKSQRLLWKPLKNDRLSQPKAFTHAVIVKRGWRKQMHNAKKLPIVFSPSGNVSPFKLILMDRNDDRAYSISVKENGASHLKEFSQ